MASAIAAILTTSVLVLALPMQAFAYVPPAGVNQYGGGAGLSVLPPGVNSGQVLTGQTYGHPSCTATHTCAAVLSGIAILLAGVHAFIEYGHHHTG